MMLNHGKTPAGSTVPRIVSAESFTLFSMGWGRSRLRAAGEIGPLGRRPHPHRRRPLSHRRRTLESGYGGVPIHRRRQSSHDETGWTGPLENRGPVALAATLYFFRSKGFA